MGTNGSFLNYTTIDQRSSIFDSDQSSSSAENNSNNSHLPDCSYEDVDFDRFMLIVCLGTPLAVLGVIFNLILCLVFSRLHHLKSCDLYFFILALLDSSFCVLYILVMTVDAISLHNGYTGLYSIYMTYVFSLFAVSKIIQLCSVYMVVAATLERFFLVNRWSDTLSANSPHGPNLFRPTLRLCVVVSILAAVVCLRSPAFWEYTVETNPECEDPFGSYQIEPRLMAIESYGIFSFYIMNVIQVFLPFVLLTFLNLQIIRTLRRRLSLAKKFLFPIRYVSEISFERGVSREKLKSATYTLVALVSGYLISSLFNTFITTLEQLAPSLLKDEHHTSYRWYTLASDISSVFTIANSCSRLPLYCVCSRAVRHEIAQLFHFLFGLLSPKRSNNNRRRSSSKNAENGTTTTPATTSSEKVPLNTTVGGD